MSERIRRVLRFRLALIQLLVIPVILTIFTSLPALAVDVTFTADNAYQLWYGTATSVAAPPISPAVVNTLAAEISSCGIPGPESYLNISNADGGYIYIVAWSDQSTTQGVLGQFVAGTSTTYTGIGGWEVYATGSPISPVTATPPTRAQVNEQIALANMNGGTLPNSSVGWVTQAPPTGGRIGLLASGETNDSNSVGNFGIVCQTLINPGARWMWYNRNSDGSGNPFGPPKPLGEYLIFRLPVSQIVNPTAFYANKDIKNMTGVTAFGVEIEVAGHHSYNAIYRDPLTPVFTLDATGANDKLRYTGGTIPAGAVVHVGFWTNDSVINMLGVTMLDAGGASIGCALQLDTNIHENVDLTWHNTVTNCTASPMYVGNVWLEYYFDQVRLEDLVAGGARTPFHTVTLKMAATLIAPSGTLTVPIPAAPNGARWMVVHQGIGSTAALGETEDWLQVPIEIPTCSRLYTVTNANQLAAIDVDNACTTTMIGVTRDTASGPVRRIRGLAYAGGIMYGMTREGDLVTVNRLTAATTFLFAVSPHGSPPNFWGGLAFNGTDKLYSTNAFGAHELVAITNGTSATVVGSTTFNGNLLQILGLDFYPSSAPLVPPTFNGTHPAPSVLYGSNRTNDNIVVVNPSTGAVTMPMGNHTVGVNNLQEITFHPQTGVLYAIHDHFSSSNNAALSTYNFTTEMSTELCELPFGIVETVGGGNDTYGWGGLAFAPCPPTPTPTPTPTPPIGQLGNISSRLQVGTGGRVMIAGFIIQGSAPKQVLIRAAGPSLTQFGVPNALANPRLELHDSANTIGTNNDWQTTQIGGVITSDQVAAIQGSGLAPRDSLESAIIATLPPGSYTAIVEGVSAGTGVGIVEVFDLSLTGGSILGNIATRGFVQTGSDVMIGGFIVVTQPTRIIVRAIGPSLTQFGVADALANPTLELRDSNGALLIANNDWQDDPAQAAQLSAAGLAPANALESGLAATLSPGLYTALVAGVNNTTGNALVEVYALP